MSNNAARQGDDLIHSSVFADIASMAVEGIAYVAMGSVVAAVATVAAPVVGSAALAAVGSSCLLSGIVAGAAASLTLAQIQCSAKSEIFVFPETSDEFSRSHVI